MLTIQKVLTEFCLLTKLKKKKQLDVFQQKLEVAYEEGDRQIILSASAYGLQNPGGHLLGVFLQRHPDIEVIRVPSNMFYNPLLSSETDGFQAFILGLMATRTAGKLRVLDLSSSEYLPEQIAELMSTVIENHPSLLVLNLNAAELSDEHLAAIIPHLSSPVLQELNLRMNQFTGEHFVALSASLINHCTALRLFDLTANPVLATNIVHLETILQRNRQLFIRLPQYPQIQTLSIHNHYDFFVPSRTAIMMRQFDALESKFAQFEFRIQSLPDNPEDAGARQSIQQLEARLKHLSMTVEENKDALSHQLLMQDRAQTTQVRTIEQRLLRHETRQDAFEDSLERQREQSADLRGLIESTYAQMSELETRLTLSETGDRELSSHLVALKHTLAQHADSIDTLEESIDILQSLQEKLTHLEELFSATLSSELDSVSEDLTPEQLAYTLHFKKILVRMHLTAMVISTGLINLNTTGKLGKAGQVLNAISSSVPLGVGFGLKIMAYCLQTVDKAIAMRRFERLSQLGNDQMDVVRLSEQLSKRLIRCLNIDNTVKEHHMMKLLSGSGEIALALVDNGFYGALTQVFEMAVDPVIENAVGNADISTMEKRAEQDANLFLAAVAEQEIMLSSSGDFNRLFLYAVPLLTVVDRVFFLIVDKFCQKQSCEPKNLSINAKKRGIFYGNVTKSWHQHASFVAESLEDTSQRDHFTNDIAQNFTDRTSGVFYFKDTTSLTVFSGALSSKCHASWHEEALLPETAEAVMRVVVAGR